MTKDPTRRYQETLDERDVAINRPSSPPLPPAEPIYDLTSRDEKTLVKAGTERERGDE